jgi:hypothetical protein
MSIYPSKIRWANTLAHREVNELLQALTDLANLGDTAADFRFFRRRWPDFFPVSLYEATEQDFQSPEGRVFGKFREGVRKLWTGADRAPHLAVTMLDIHNWGLSYVIDPSHKVAQVNFGWEWSSGEFVYASNVKFHQALFVLLGRSRLAKVCPHCSQCFLAKRGTQLYCSTDCSEIAEREWKREWWRKNGEAWRAKWSRAKGQKDHAAKGRTGAADSHLR